MTCWSPSLNLEQESRQRRCFCVNTLSKSCPSPPLPSAGSNLPSAASNSQSIALKESQLWPPVFSPNFVVPAKILSKNCFWQKAREGEKLHNSVQCILCIISTGSGSKMHKNASWTLICRRGNFPTVDCCSALAINGGAAAMLFQSTSTDIVLKTVSWAKKSGKPSLTKKLIKGW